MKLSKPAAKKNGLGYLLFVICYLSQIAIIGFIFSLYEKIYTKE